LTYVIDVQLQSVKLISMKAYTYVPHQSDHMYALPVTQQTVP